LTKGTARPQNRFLRSLSIQEYQRLLPFAETVNLGSGDILFEAGDRITDLYFLNSGMASLLSTTEGGATIEVGMVGYEGFVGTSIVLKQNRMPYRSMMQIAGQATKIKTEPVLDQFDTNVRFRNLLLQYLHLILAQVSQSAVCNRFHTLEERLCRWLMISCDIIHSDEIPLTQELCRKCSASLGQASR
jgi:CRP-like cAMP-binding protein